LIQPFALQLRIQLAKQETLEKSLNNNPKPGTFGTFEGPTSDCTDTQTFRPLPRLQCASTIAPVLMGACQLTSSKHSVCFGMIWITTNILLKNIPIIFSDIQCTNTCVGFVSHAEPCNIALPLAATWPCMAWLSSFWDCPVHDHSWTGPNGLISGKNRQETMDFPMTSPIHCLKPELVKHYGQ
jgi:hypothetical protein